MRRTRSINPYDQDEVLCYRCGAQRRWNDFAEQYEPCCGDDGQPYGQADYDDDRFERGRDST